MKTILVSVILAAISSSMFGCINRGQVPVAEPSPSTADSCQRIASPFNAAMKKAIIQYIDNLDPNETPKDMIHISLLKEEGERYVLIISDPYYYKDYTQGYSYINGYTIVRTDVIVPDIVNDSCFRCLIDGSKLIPYCDSIPGYVDHRDYPEGHYEPMGIKYKVITPDSLLLVYTGMF